MFNHQKPYLVRLFLLVVVLLVGAIIGVQTLSPSIVADSPATSLLYAYQDKAPNDALGRALLVAQSQGLNEKADAIFVKQATFKEFEEPEESWPIWDERSVWAIRFDKHFIRQGRGILAQSSAVDYLVVFIDEQTGELAGVRWGTELPSQLQKTDWAQVQETDIGSFPVGSADMPPAFYSQGQKSAVNPGATQTPAER